MSGDFFQGLRHLDEGWLAWLSRHPTRLARGSRHLRASVRWNAGATLGSADRIAIRCPTSSLQAMT